MMAIIVNAATPPSKHRHFDDDDDDDDDHHHKKPKNDDDNDNDSKKNPDSETTTPKKKSWLEDIDFDAIEGEVRPVGSGICKDAKCDGTDNDQCFETCGNLATHEDIYGCKYDKTWALTFDDGPSEFTQELLDILDKLDVKATFCVMGSHVKKFPEIIKRAYESGHQIASHTYSHPHLMSLSNEDIVYEVRATEEAIEDVIGVKPKYIRPPYGEADKRVKGLLKQMGYKVLMWNVDPTDYDVYNLKDGAKRIQDTFEKVLKNNNSSLNVHADDGFISLQHDLYRVSIHQVPQIYRALRKHDYSLTTAAECIGDDEPHIRMAVPRPAASASNSSLSGKSLPTNLSGSNLSDRPNNKALFDKQNVDRNVNKENKQESSGSIVASVGYISTLLAAMAAWINYTI
ncbi:hypothetical protein RMCBS344292_00408 [Rhizopus microsporus]|nr:hypothetical protein RMCBS344292_00408 [Rhizopus microsporus]